MNRLRFAFVNTAHIGTHLLFAAIGAMVWRSLTGASLDLPTTAFVLLGSLLPDLDTSSSFIGRAFLPLSRFLEERFGHRQEVHTLWPPLALWLASRLPFLSPSLSLALTSIAVGYTSHLALDTLNPAGVGLLLPLTPARAMLLGGRVRSRESSEIILLVILLAGAVATAGLTRLEPGEIVQRLVPTIETAREQYRQWEGLYRVYADVEGTWNKTHQRYAGQVEVLGLDAAGALQLHDRQTGQTFTASQRPVDDLYISTITLYKGEPIAASTPVPTALPTPTPIIVPILVEGVRDPDFEILIRPGDFITQGQLIAELVPPPASPTPQAADGGQAQSIINTLALAELNRAKAEYQCALEGQPADDATILQAEAAIAQIEASIASLQYLQAANPNLSYVPAQIAAAQARLAAAQARLESVKRGKGPTAGQVALAKAKLQLAELHYQQAIATPTPAPTPAAAPAPTPIRSVVRGRVRAIYVSRVVGNVATIEILVELVP